MVGIAATDGKARKGDATERTAKRRAQAQRGSIRRRTQAERSAETRERLRAAAINCLLERGYARATSVEIAARAGLSRGALNHHYAGKHDLIVDAANLLWDQVEDNLRALVGGIAPEGDGLDAFVDGVWERVFGHRRIVAVLELVVAGRGDPKLDAWLRARLRRLFATYDAIGAMAFSGGVGPDKARALVNLTLTLARGMALQSVMHDDPAQLARLRDAWKAAIPILMRDPTFIAGGTS